jgi:SAM-dependent methyltransferase
MTLTPTDWYARFRQQAGWTRQLRQYIFEQLALKDYELFLEVGCGPGAVLVELDEDTPAGLHGLDINSTFLELAHQYAPGARLTQADAHHLPYQNDSFDAAGCHFLLLWVHDPAQVVRETARVVHPGGAVLLMAEPDYGGRIDFPHELSILGEWQTESLRIQGANPLVGRRLAALLTQAGLGQIESGVLGGGWASTDATAGWEMEWQVLVDDLHRLPGVWPDRQAEIDYLQAIDRLARSRGERVLFVPTFYAWGRKSA